MSRYFLISASHPSGHTSIQMETIFGFPNRIDISKKIIASLPYDAKVNDICILSIYEFKSKQDSDDYDRE